MKELHLPVAQWHLSHLQHNTIRAIACRATPKIVQARRGDMILFNGGVFGRLIVAIRDYDSHDALRAGETLEYLVPNLRKAQNDEEKDACIRRALPYQNGGHYKLRVFQLA